MSVGTIEVGGITVPLGDHLTPEIRQGLQEGDYEQAELAAIEAILDTEDIVMEIGTGLGLLSAWCARVVGSDRVFTFEANPALEPKIRELYRLNGVSPQLEICVLGESAGSAEFFPRSEFWASSVVPTEPTGEPVTVAARSFAQALAAIRPTVLIIDIEGGELQLIHHARLDGVKRVLIELHPDVIGEQGCESVVRTLVQGGFALEPPVWGSDTVFTFDRAAESGSSADTLRDALAEMPWRRADRALQVLLGTVPPGADFVLLDESLWWHGNEFGDRRRRFVVDRDGDDYGAPDDGTAAVAELECRRSAGADWLAVAWPAFWWFEEFPELFRHLARFPEVVRTRDIRIWQLSGG